MSDISIQWLIVFVDVSLKAALVALLAAAGMAVLRVRDSNLRHRVWAGVLCGMMFLPALTQVLPALRLPFTINPEWFAALNPADIAVDSDDVDSQPTHGDPVAAVAPNVDSLPAQANLESPENTEGRGAPARSDWPGARGQWQPEYAADSPSPALSNDEIANDKLSRPLAASTAPAEPEPVADKKQQASVFQAGARFIPPRLPVIILTVWIAGSLVLALRLLTGMWIARALRRASRLIAPSEFPASQNQFPSPLGGEGLGARGDGKADLPMSRRNVPILACPLIRVPLTLGVFRPQILLPPEWTDWSPEKLHAVLVHERTHAERGDCALALLAEVNRCVYWFHPLAWWLRRHLASLAEAACDDAAIGSTGDRTSYARHLLEVAATARAHRGRLVIGGVSMARCSSVESRIDTILDATRPLSQRLTWATTLALLGVIVPLVALTAALRPSNGTGDAQTAAADVQKEAIDTVKDEPASTAIAQPEPVPSTEYSVLSTQNSVLGTDLPITQSLAQDAASNSKSDVTFTFAGTVVGPDGQPVAGAKISLSYFHKSPQPPSAATAAVSDNRGKFEFSMKQSDLVGTITGGSWFRFDAGLVAEKEGFGFAFAPATFFETSGRLDGGLSDYQRESIERQGGKKTDVLTLVRDDVPIRGRILNADGRPVAGASVEAFEFWEGNDGTLDAWEAATKEQEASSSSAMRHLREILRGHWMTFNWTDRMGTGPARLDVNQGNLFTGTRPPIVPAARTDANGWFTLKGVGRERIAEVLISGPGIETTQQRVRSRPGNVVKLGLHEPAPYSDVTIVYYPNEFTFVSGPSVPVTGRVTDAKTGQPLAGVGIQSTEQFRGAVTDKEGKYRLEGLPLGANSLFVTPPAGSRHLAGGVTVTTAAAAPPLVRDITLMPGVWVRGRAIDETTGRPLRGNLEYFAYETNSQKTESDSLRLPNIRSEFHPDADGRFEIPVLPGPGILGFRAGQEFPDAVGADQIDGPRHEDAGDAPIFNTVPRWCDAREQNLLVAVNPRPEDDELIVSLTLRSGLSVPVRVLAPDGQPLSGYRVFGSRRHWVWPVNPGETFRVLGYSATETRRLMVYHEGRDLVGHFDLKGEPPKEIVITLQPAATIVGRVLDADGPAFEHADIWDLRYNVFLNGKPSADDLTHGVLQMNAKTDSQGRFQLKGIVPGLKYTAHLNFFRDPSEKELNTSLQGPIFVDITAEPGQTKDLGDLRLVLDSGKPATPVKAEKESSEKPEAKPGVDPAANGGKKDGSPATKGAAAPGPAKANLPSTEYSVLSTQSPARNNSESGKSRTIRGRVVDSKDQPIAGVTLEIPGTLLRGPPPDGKPTDGPKATTDKDGQFVLEVPDKRRLPLIASHDGFAVELFDVPVQGDVQEAKIVLHPEQLIHGRMIDAEGRPVAGARVFIRERLAAGRVKSVDEYLEERKKNRPGQPVETRFLTAGFLPQSYLATSDAEGRFVVRGIAADSACGLQISADQFLSSRLVVVNRQGLDPDPYNQQNQPAGPARPGAVRLVGPDFTHVGIPGLVIEGRATVEGKPAADVIVRAGANFGVLGATTTDADGRYKLTGLPRGGELRVLFGGPERPSDLLTHSVTLSTTADDLRQTVDVELKRASSEKGTLLTGHVIDPLTGKGVPAFVRFVPLAGNEFADKPAYKDLKAGGTLVRANAEGAFRVPVIPGPGALLVQVNGTIQIGRQMFSPFRLGSVSEDDKPKLKITGERGAGQFIPTADGKGAATVFQCAIKYINLEEGGEPKPVEIMLDRGKTLELDIFDGEGKSVTGASIVGIEELSQAARLGESRTTIYALSSEAPRTVFVLHGQRGLAGSLKLTGDEPSPVRMTLGKAASIRGRAVDKSGEPIAEAAYDTFSTAAYKLFELENAGRPQITTDKEGRFQVGNIIPGERFSFNIRLEGNVLFAKLTDEQQTLKPGQELDLGNVVFTAPNPQQPQPNEAKKPGDEPKSRTAP